MISQGAQQHSSRWLLKKTLHNPGELLPAAGRGLIAEAQLKNGFLNCSFGFFPIQNSTGFRGVIGKKKKKCMQRCEFSAQLFIRIWGGSFQVMLNEIHNGS